MAGDSSHQKSAAHPPSRAYCSRLSHAIIRVTESRIVVILAIIIAATLVASVISNEIIDIVLLALILFTIYAGTGEPNEIITFFVLIAFFPILASLAFIDICRPISYRDKKTPLVFVVITLVVIAVIVKFQHDVNHP